MAYEHLTFDREPDSTERHRQSNPQAGPPKPENPRQHGVQLGQSLAMAKERAGEDRPGYDDRILLKVRLQEGVRPPDLDNIPGVEVLSEEDGSVMLAFMSEEGMRETEQRLATLARDGAVTRKELFYAVQGYDHWTPEDRMGPALAAQGLMQNESMQLDVELWPEEFPDRRRAMLESFKRELENEEVEILDHLQLPSLLLLRVRCRHHHAEGLLLQHRDVRTVDLPPRTGLAIDLITRTVDAFPEVERPTDDAPRLAVLDTGVTENHPLLAPVMGDARDYLGGATSHHADDHRHGTFVAGLAAHGDVAEAIRQGRLVPLLRIVSGRVFDESTDNHTRLVERAVEDAVRELREDYGCRVFNLSYGDLNKVYDGRHVRGLGYTLDQLASELDVLFVVPSGNLLPDDLPADPLGSYPDYFFEDHSRLLDPAPALNALCVGGIASLDTSQQAQQYPENLEERPIAGVDQPFPLTRSGPSIGNAIKPDLVDESGNVVIDRQGRPRWRGAGVLSLNSGFASGFPLSQDIGTSYAAPRVAHHLARLESHLPTPPYALVIRALAGVHADWPEPTKRLLDCENLKKEERDRKLLDLVGYGRLDADHLYRSSEEHVVLLAEERIESDICQFFTLPMPEELWQGRRRTRTVSVSLAYSPEVRTTRLDYRKTRLSFKLVAAESLEEVQAAFQRDREQGMKEHDNRRWITDTLRRKGTLQVSRWQFSKAPKRQNLYVVVTRQDNAWAQPSRSDSEPYALAVTVNDRENESAKLYQTIRAQLRARADTRVRART